MKTENIFEIWPTRGFTTACSVMSWASFFSQRAQKFFRLRLGLHEKTAAFSLISVLLRGSDRKWDESSYAEAGTGGLDTQRMQGPEDNSVEPARFPGKH